MVAGNGKTLERDAPQEADVRDLASVITRALTELPVDEQSLRRGVWTFVEVERQAGTPPGRVILTLTELIDASPIATAHRQLVTQRVILWCVEAYFGHLGGDSVTYSSHVLGDAPVAGAAR